MKKAGVEEEAIVVDSVQPIVEMNVKEMLHGLPQVVRVVAVNQLVCQAVRQVAIHLQHHRAVLMAVRPARQSAITAVHPALAVVLENAEEVRAVLPV